MNLYCILAIYIETVDHVLHFILPVFYIDRRCIETHRYIISICSHHSVRREYFVEQDNGAVLYILCKLYEQCISRFLLDLKCRYIYHVFIYILRCIFFGIVYLMYTFININGVNNLIAGILILYYINMRIIFFIQLQWTIIILWSYYIKKRKYFLAKDYASHIRYNILMLYRFSEYKVKFYYWF